MHLWAHLQGGEAMGRCPFRATRPGGCRSGDHIHEAVTASPRTRPKRSPQGHGLLPNQQRTDALRPVSEPRSLRRLGSGRSRLQDDHRATTEAVGNALDSQPRQRNYCPSLFPAQWPLGRILGTTRRWLISGRFFTYKFGAHPAMCDGSQSRSTSMRPQPSKGIGNSAFKRNLPAVSASVSNRRKRNASVALRARAGLSASDGGTTAAWTNSIAKGESTPSRTKRRTLVAYWP